MNNALREHLGRMLARFAKEAAQFSPGAARQVFMYGCAKLAFDKATQPEERRYWRKYMDDVNKSLQRYKNEKLARLR